MQSHGEQQTESRNVQDSDSEDQLLVGSGSQEDSWISSLGNLANGSTIQMRKSDEEIGLGHKRSFLFGDVALEVTMQQKQMTISVWDLGKMLDRQIQIGEPTELKREFP